MNPLDKELERLNKSHSPIRVGLVGGGNVARAIALQLLVPPPGIRLVAVANRTLAKARQAFEEAGVDSVTTAHTAGEVDQMVVNGRAAILEDAFQLCRASQVDVIVEATGTVEFGAQVVSKAVEEHKHVVLFNAELDSTLGPILKVHADRHGVVLTNTDGDEPGVAMNLLRYLRSLGLTPVAAGNLKGMIDPYRTPDTQRDFAARYHQNPTIVTSFADGTKLSMEAAILANASGFRAGKRGMHGPRCAHVKEIGNLLPKDQLLSGGLVDYALGAEPHTGAFVVCHEDNPLRQWHFSYLKMGDGPFYVFYTPFHLPHIQLASSIGRAALLHDATVAPLAGPVCEVITLAKRDLKAGDKLDGVGGFTAYGVLENSRVARSEDLLPMGLSLGCVLKTDVPKDQPILRSEVDVPPQRFCDPLWEEQRRLFCAE
jgi:predicted homoserine dehydrogenase-like protein